MTICNACRYCEGYCAVFPAMERRTVFDHGDLAYLANLCHNCGECYYACPFTPPHEFAVNVPKLLAELRAQSYRQAVWPQWYGAAGTIPILVASLLAFLWAGRSTSLNHALMTTIFGIAGIYVIAALAISIAKFTQNSAAISAAAPALRATASLKYLGGARRAFHHVTFYGFLLCFASTTSAAINYYLLGLKPPYPLISMPVILGVLGGVGLLIGPVGLFVLKLRRDGVIVDERQNSADSSFIALLFLTSVTGLLLLALRDTSEAGVLLRVHLAIVLTLFLTMPYGKFVHGFYRFAALLRYASETAAVEK